MGVCFPPSFDRGTWGRADVLNGLDTLAGCRGDANGRKESGHDVFIYPLPSMNVSMKCGAGRGILFY